MMVNRDGLRAFVESVRDDFPVTVPAGFVRELLALVGDEGPQVVSSRQAAQKWGWKARDWARWAAEGLIPGSVRSGRGWDLPSAACQVLFEKRMGRTAAATAPVREVTPRLSDRRGNHVSRAKKAKARQQAAGQALPLAPRLVGR